MSNHMDVVFSPGLYLDRDKKALAFIEDRLLHQESCAAVCMYGNSKDYLFSNVLKRLEMLKLTYELKVLNTVSADELKDFADMLEAENKPTLCLVNLRIGKDVSWFMRALEELRVQRGHAFVSFVSSYVGDIFEALTATTKAATHSLYILKRVPYEDALHMIDELSERFEFQPTESQKQDIYAWGRGHAGMLRTLFLLKRDHPDELFTEDALLREPTIVERLNHILQDIPPEQLRLLMSHRLGFIEHMIFEEFGYIDANDNLFSPLLAKLLTYQTVRPTSALSFTEKRVLDYLRDHPDEVVARGAIARIVWGEEEWEDKYSDWAIGQLMYRLRKKLEYAAEPGTIETRKREGFTYLRTTVS